MSESFKIEWIPKLLETIQSLTDLEPEIQSDIKSAVLLLQEKNLKIQKKKEKKMKKNLKRKNAPPYTVRLTMNGSLPHNLRVEAFRAAVVPMFEDLFNGEVIYQGFSRMNNGTYCYNFSGMCPIHMRMHDGGARIWQLKQHPRSEWCGWKCWKNDSYKKLFSNPILTSF